MSDELTRKQRELDDARELLLEVGASNFGSLKEGIEQLLGAAKEMVLEAGDTLAGKSVVIGMSPDDIETMESRVRATAARLASDADFRMHLAFMMEVMGCAMSLYERATKTDSTQLLRQIRSQLNQAIREQLQQRRQA